MKIRLCIRTFTARDRIAETLLQSGYTVWYEEEDTHCSIADGYYIWIEGRMEVGDERANT